jgi:hypothetical protein
MIFCARATRGLRRPLLDARSGGLIRAILEQRTRASLEGSSVALATPLSRKNKKSRDLAFSEDWAYFHQETVRHVEAA